MAQDFNSFLGGLGLKPPEDFEAKAKGIEAGRTTAMQPFVDKSKSLSSEMKAIGDTLAKREAPKAPDYKPLPDAPNLEYQDPMQAMGSMASLLAIVGSLRTRAPLTSALNAAAASMEGFHKGDQERLKLEQTKWKDNLELGLKQNQMETEKYTNALKAADYDFSKAQAQMRVIAAEHQDNTMLAAIETGNWDRQYQLLEQKTKLGFEIAKLKEGDDLKRAMMAMRGGGAGGLGGNPEPLTPGGLKIAAEMTRRGISLPGGWSRVGMSRGNSILNRMAEEESGTPGGGGSNVPADRADYKAKSLALNQITKDLAAIRPYNDMLDKNGKIAIDLAQKVIATDSKLANKPINWIRQNVGDNPDTAEFLAQTRIVTTESARVLNNPRLVGQLTDSARHEMESIVNGEMPLNSFIRVVKRLQSDGNNRVSSMASERESLLRDLGQRRAGDSTSGGGAQPTDSDRAWARSHPEDAAKFKAHFGVEP